MLLLLALAEEDHSSWSDEMVDLRTKKWDAAVNDRLRSLRKLQCAPNSGLWLTASPAAWPERFSAPEFQLLLAVRTGAKVFQEGAPCKACGQGMDPWGDHAQSCGSAGLCRRHNRVRNTLWQLGKKAGWSPL